MRNHLLTKSAFRIVTASLVAAGVTFVVHDVKADAVAATCDAASLECATGTAAFHAESKASLPTSIGIHGSASAVSLDVDMSMDPVGTDPLYAVDMSSGAMVEASWPDKGFLNVRVASGTPSKGSLKVHHSLTPAITGSVLGFQMKLDATQYLRDIPGSDIHYDYKGETAFDPWGLAPAALTMPAPTVAQSTIYSTPLPVEDITDGLSDLLGGFASIDSVVFSLQATTAPKFTYQTRTITFQGAAPITDAAGVAKVAVGDVDALDLDAHVQGDLHVAGSMQLRGIIDIKYCASAFGFSVCGKSKAVDVKFAAKDYDVPPVPVDFAQKTIHIPLPNLKAPGDTSVGTVAAGSSVDKTVTLQNSGKLGAKFKVVSSDPQFVISTNSGTISPKGSADIHVTFKPTSAGPASTTLTITSNDPDSPEQTLKLTANGAGPNDNGSANDGTSNGDSAAPGAAPSADTNADSGCTVSRTGTSRNAGGAFAFLALGLAALIRRRRQA